MARHIELTADKTYASKVNAIKAVEKLYPAANNDGLDFLIMTTDDGRFSPVFLGERSIKAGVQFHFHIAG